MRCPSCSCPAFSPLLFGGICFNKICKWFDPQALHKAVYDDDGFVNNDFLWALNDFLGHLPD